MDVDALGDIIASVGQLKGVAMKAGQLMSYLDLSIPEELRSALAVLQTHSPPMPFSDVAEVIERELGPRAAPLLAHMDPVAVAAASIGQVHRARLPDGVEVARSFYGPMLEDKVRAIQLGEARPLGGMLANKRAMMKLRLPPEMLFIIRIRFGVMAVLARLGARANWYRLERGFSRS